MQLETRTPGQGAAPGRAGDAAAGSGYVTPRVARVTDMRRPSGCPCGCESRPRLFDDDRCARHRRPELAGPSTYGLSAAELSAEVAARRLDGWGNWELRVRFVDPRELVA